jgi:hypothetical protein
MSYQNKYLKYKNKYLNLKNRITQIGGSSDIKKNKCEICNENARFNCSQCKIVFYCSKDHQIQDWVTHKKKCKAPLSSSTVTSKLETSKLESKPSSLTETSKLDSSPSSLTETSKLELSPSSLTETSKLELSPSSSTVTSSLRLDNELSVRREAGRIALESFIQLNNSYDFSKGPLEHIKYKHRRWHQNFLFPPKEFSQQLKNIYDNCNYSPKPRFNLTDAELEEAFNFIKTPDSKHVLECRAAMYMVNMRIFYKLLPNLFKYLFDISIIDQIIEKHSKQIAHINGYDKTFEIDKLNNMYKDHIFEDSDLNDINKVLLDSRKAKRLYIIHDIISRIFLMTPDPKLSEIKIGNTYYIKGHPNYDSSWGENVGVYVICVNINESNKPLFIGFSGNQRFSGRKSFKFDQALSLEAIQEGLRAGYVADMANAKIKKNELQVYINFMNSASGASGGGMADIPNMADMAGMIANAQAKIIEYNLKINEDHLKPENLSKLLNDVKEQEIPIKHMYNLNFENVIQQEKFLTLFSQDFPKKSVDQKNIQDQEILQYPDNEKLKEEIKRKIRR